VANCDNVSILGVKVMITVGMAEQNQQQELINRVLYGVNTCIPGTIIAFYPDTQTVSVQPAIRYRHLDLEDKETFSDPPVILKVPLCFPFTPTAGYALTLPVKAGDSCIIMFSQRAIDNWHDHGGVQPPESDAAGCRHHDLTDAFVLLAPTPIPAVLGAWEDDGIAIRNRANTSHCTIKDDSVIMQVGSKVLTLSSTGAHLVGDLTVTGNISDGIRSMAADRTIYNGHHHSTSPVPTEQM